MALDVKTGRERWTFRTVNHDVWDYDVAAQPLLFDLHGSGGTSVPALVELTKRGQIFLLDRRDGHPLAAVAQRPAPTDTGLPGDSLAATQPYSVGLPQIGADPLTETKMWGATPLDQLWCRIAFRKLRYEGDFTPESVRPIIIWPGWLGGFNWGGGTIDETRNYLIATDIRVPVVQRMVPRAEADPRLKAMGGDYFTHGHLALRPQFGQPWAVEQAMFMSPLGIPCNEPPWGTVSAIDLIDRRIVWEVPAGTAHDNGPLGFKTHLPISIGMPTLGGAISTAGGLVFHAGTQDYYLRAYATDSGKELWRGPLPVGAQATPMSYVSSATGKQYVVVVAGGMRYTQDVGDYVVAYSLGSKNE